MQKLLSSIQIREADSYTILHEPISSIDLMERAASKCCAWLSTKFANPTEFFIFCGTGNNGGDGFAIARLLLQKEYKVSCVLIGQAENFSPDCKKNYESLLLQNSAALLPFKTIKELLFNRKDMVIVDAMFGSGLSRPLESPYTEIVEWLNQLNATIVAIDLPSGMFVEPSINGKMVSANYTLSFQFPKLSFLLPETGNSVGELILLDIGLDKNFIANVNTTQYYIEKNDIKNLMVNRKPFSHKGSFGHALIVAGSEGKMGAAVLSTHACLRSGCGLVTALVPENGKAIIQATLPEAMLYMEQERIQASSNLTPFSAVGIGPGIGMDADAAQSLKLLIQNYRAPIVFDADALNLIAQNKTWLGFLQNEVVLTPHLKEFERLTEKAKNDFHRLELAKAFSNKYNIYLVLKGKYSCLVCPDGNFYFNSTGNSGMAKGGSGDALTGIITSILAQGYSAKDACLIGVYVHGLAGDLAAEKFSEIAMTAGDIIYFLPEAFKRFVN